LDLEKLIKKLTRFIWQNKIKKIKIKVQLVKEKKNGNQ
jgi:hypothetical protein